ncbi:alpha/beta hydrolase [Alishewanella longhuensis]|uniref:Alpha/beta hydrolase n=1 Tax=Alishewanella longhuensis TaxID=1091037 RepID=A0ABQ3L3R4_9ALTE|nr:alpha/beta fold hydrolase [Alishewanella longhuensis]GHG78338.1 alpha/beta hydrolase [Alishewanella longhuensis]
MRMLLTLTGYVLAGYCLLCLLLYLLQRQLIYFPVAAQLPATEPLILQQANATVLVSRKARDSSQALLYFGGNAEDVSVALSEFAAAFPNHAIYLMHYRGYGGSSGSPSEQALVADALTLFDQLQSKHSDITVLGRSLGSGVAVQLAAQRKVAQLVLITPFDSLSALAQQQFPLFPVRRLLKDTYTSVAYAPAITSPTLILVAEQDEIIARTHSEALYRAFSPGVATLKSYTGSHNSELAASQIAAWLAATIP